MKKPGLVVAAIVLLSIIILAVLKGLGLLDPIIGSTENTTPSIIAFTPTPSLPAQPTSMPTPTLAPLTPTLQPTATLVPFTATPTFAPTFTQTPAPSATPTFVGVVINGCVTEPIGRHPYTGAPLIFLDQPYPGVICEYEFFSNELSTRIIIAPGQAAIVEDWLLSCPTGPECEGVWTAIDSFEVPAGWLVHVWLFSDSNSAEGRFPSHACEYAAKQDHTDANIRVPTWALDSGSIFNHPGCPLGK